MLTEHIEPTATGLSLVRAQTAQAARDAAGASSGVWPLSMGGTGAGTQAGALAALGVFPIWSIPVAYVNNRYYQGPYALAPTTTRAMVNGAAYMGYFVCRAAWTPNEMSVNVTSAGTSLRLGLYSVNLATGLPAALIAQTGEIDVSGTGVKSGAITASLTPGVYAYIAAPNASVTCSAFPDSSSIGRVIFGASAFTEQTVSAAGVFTYGSLPDPWVASFGYSNNNQLAVALRKTA